MEGRRSVAHLRAVFAATFIACADRHAEASHTTRSDTRSTRGRTHPKDTQDAEHDAEYDVEHAALPYWLRTRWSARERSGSESEGECEGGYGEKETSAQRGPLPAARVPWWRESAPPAIHGALRLGMGECTTVLTTARARGDAPAPTSARSSSTPMPTPRAARRRWTIPTAARLSIPPPTSTVRDDAPARLSFDLSLSLISDTFSSSISTPKPPPSPAAAAH
ncbi:hypothetical protein DFH09DRAFT_1345265 [Mycena vulgaris]|nr:hypothetical protein DFH09DRAFT_1345265 [Mycena vulgaris]